MCHVILIPPSVLCPDVSFANAYMEKKANRAGLTHSFPSKGFLARLALGWELGFQDFYHSQIKLSIQTIWLMLNTRFPSGSLERWYMPGRGCPCDQPQQKSPGTKPLTSFPAGNISHALPHIAPRELGVSCVPLPRRLWSLCLFPCTSPHVSLPFAEFALYPLAIKNLSHYDYNRMPSPVS